MKKSINETEIIFADVDGVFTSARTGWFNFDLYAVNFIRWVCENSAARIVISSTWRSRYPLGFWRKIFGDAMFLGDDWRTPYLNSPERRGGEINLWLQKHPQVNKYLILDDDSDFTEEQKAFHIKTDSHNGLLFEQMMLIRTFFGITSHFKDHWQLYQHKDMFASSREENSAEFQPYTI